MADNPYVNKVVVNDVIKLDLTGDTVVPDALREGYTAHDASGAPITGTAVSYSPVKEINSDYTLTADDVGKTLLIRGVASGVDTVTITVPGGSAIPLGAEFAMFTSANVEIQIQAGSGAYLACYLWSSATSQKKLAITGKYRMCAIKKYLSPGSYLVTGPVKEVTA